MNEGLQTKDAIAQAFKYLVVHSDSKKITIQMITEQCGASRKTFYYHFSDHQELVRWIFRSELGNLLTTSCSKDDLVYLPPKTRLSYPEYPYFARATVMVRHFDSSQFFRIFGEYLQESRVFYKQWFSTQPKLGFTGYVFKLYCQAFQEDIQHILGGRHLPPTTVLQLAKIYANAFTSNYFDTLLCSNTDLRTLLPEEFSNILHESMTNTVNGYFQQKKNSFNFFDR